MWQFDPISLKSDPYLERSVSLEYCDSTLEFIGKTRFILTTIIPKLNIFQNIQSHQWTRYEKFVILIWVVVFVNKQCTKLESFWIPQFQNHKPRNFETNQWTLYKRCYLKENKEIYICYEITIITVPSSTEIAIPLLQVLIKF